MKTNEVWLLFLIGLSVMLFISNPGRSATACKQDDMIPCRVGTVSTCENECAGGQHGCALLEVYAAIWNKPWCTDAPSGDWVCINTPTEYYCYQLWDCDRTTQKCYPGSTQWQCSTVGYFAPHTEFGSMQDDTNCRQ